MQTAPKYLCYFFFGEERPLKIRTTFDNPEVPALSGLRAFGHGFWLNDKLELDYRSDEIRYWIPPSAIIRVEKIT